VFVNFNKFDFASMFAESMPVGSQKLWIKWTGDFWSWSSGISARPEQKLIDVHDVYNYFIFMVKTHEMNTTKLLEMFLIKVEIE